MKLGILFAICQLILLQCSAQVLILEIGQIQGEGLFSPYLGQRVSTLNNVVTAITSDGFYIQSPGIRHDQNPNTSDAIKVFTGNRPQLDTNAVVSVTGTISEINDLTQFRGEDLDIQLTTGFIPLPEPVILDKNFPSPIETAPPDLEKVEGMLIEFNALATGPKIGAADIPVTTQPERSFREPGIRFPGIQGLPVWDGNPELFWISPTESDSNSLNFVNALTTITCSRALLTQSGDRYLAFPQSSLALTPAVNTESIRSKKADEWTVGSLNLLMLDHSDPFFEIKASKLSRYIHDRMLLPDILAVQESRDQLTLTALAERIQRLHPGMEYRVFFTPGNSDFHVAFLVRPGISVLAIEPLGKDLQFSNRELFDRPPLLLTLQLNDDASTRLQVLNLHLRSLIDIENPARAEFVREKRFRQSVEVAKMVQDLRDENLLIVGDFNAFEFSDGYVDVLSQITGGSSLGAIFPPNDIVAPALINHTAQLPPKERYSFIFQGNAELLDHCVSNQFRGLAVRDVAMVRGNADFASDWAGFAETPLRSSDHDGLLAYLGPEASNSSQSIELSDLIQVTYPNPCSNGAQLSVRNPNGGPVSLEIVDQRGQVRYTLDSPAERFYFTHSLQLNLPSGHYWLKIKGPKSHHVRPLIFING